MQRVLIGIAGALLVLAALAGIYAYQRVSSLDFARVTDGVHVLYGLGGNVGVLRTDRGAVVVDTLTFRMQGERVRELAEELGGGPVQAVINTHYHSDHTHGNPAFAAGTPVIATERTLELMRAFDGAYWEGATAEFLPNRTFSADHELRVGGKTVRIHHLGRGHTDGDLVVLFVEDRVVHVGDLLFNGLYPNIDLEAGGSVREWGPTIERILELDFDAVIPGHGPVTDRAGLVAFQRFMEELAGVAQQAAQQGKSLSETLASARLTTDAELDVVAIPFVLRRDRDFVLRRAWEEATGAVKPHPHSRRTP